MPTDHGPELEGLRKENAEHPIEVTGKKLRDLMSWVDRPITDCGRPMPMRGSRAAALMR